MRKMPIRATPRNGGDVLLVEAAHDAIIPHHVIGNYAAAFGKACSTRRLVVDADHGSGAKSAQQQYSHVFTKSMAEMVVGSCTAIAAERVRADRHLRQPARRMRWITTRAGS